MLTAPLPGPGPANIHIHVDGRVVALKIDLRGPHQKDDARYFQQEWMTGPYSCVIDLPVSVDASKATATYNRVLVLVLPIAQASTAQEISMAKSGTEGAGNRPRGPGFSAVARSSGSRSGRLRPTVDDAHSMLSLSVVSLGVTSRKFGRSGRRQG